MPTTPFEFSSVTRIHGVICVLIKEQTREPMAVLWTIIYPCVLYVMLQRTKTDSALAATDYLATSAWFYTYLAATNAFFGLSLYLIGRRESGFVRSFIYRPEAIKIFLIAHVMTHIGVALVYASIFYGVTRSMLGMLSVAEYVQVIIGYLLSYWVFASVGLLIALLPIKYSSANTLFSIISFFMLTSTFVGALYGDSGLVGLMSYSPLALCAVFFDGVTNVWTALGIAALFIGSVLIVGRFFRVHPVWGRY
ncbi:hypothetical protein SJI00_04200 [Pseudomonas sp. RP23018S]|uniref:hypothetical protein n=1 Tax=Pseudomonas sp. RP23018S TaxID=3096037 RepID=UPI002ACA4468|nr:hypothetical protein [Pseudomonas sp. RP23018S]MDZ5601982.1 hypothetical protein [Pseudomonas sp. RP23018S]